MAKGKAKVSAVGSEPIQNVIGANQGSRILTKEQFYTWRFNVERLMHTETKAKLIEKEFSFKALQIELEKLKLELFKNTVRSAKEHHGLAQSDYDEFLKAQETELGYSLKGKLIDEITLEVKDEE